MKIFFHSFKVIPPLLRLPTCNYFFDKLRTSNSLSKKARFFTKKLNHATI